ncbi:hypothetical protein FACS1894167_09050 [Synergistales bacterium]|nr:hypothetical protein FACS1894167_09050 [Synergistales bacterium]
MGKTLSSRTLAAKELPQLSPPVLLCSDMPDFNKAVMEAGLRTVSLNLPLARSLVGLQVREMLAALMEKIHALLPKTEPVYLTDYEMLFDPRYELDVIHLFVDLSRRNRLIVRWCGALDGETLTYAEQGCTDFKRYNIKDYEVTVVKWEGWAR